MDPVTVVFALATTAALAFASGRFAPDVVGLALVVLLVATGVLTPAEAFRGFGSETVIVILGLLILTAALSRTGVVEALGGRMLRFTGRAPFRILAVVVLTAATLSTFMSNTAATAFLVPVVLGLARRARTPVRPLLLPLAFASIVTSSVLLVGTSTNLVVSGLLEQAGEPPLGMFELTPLGLPIAVVGVTYLLFVGKFFLRAAPDDLLPDPAALRAFMSEIVLPTDSDLVGRSLGELALGEQMDIQVLRIFRRGVPPIAPRADLVLHAGDVLLVEARPEDLLRVQRTAGIEIRAEHEFADPTTPIADLGLVEAILLPRSPLVGTTLKAARFRQRHGVQVLGVSRQGALTTQKLSGLTLQVGDILILQGAHPDIAGLVEGGHLRILHALDDLAKRPPRAPFMVGLFVTALALGATGVVPLSVAVLGGAVVVFLTGGLRPNEIYREIEWSAIILIGSMLALGIALEKTGAAAVLAGHLVGAFGGHGPVALSAAFFAAAVLLTQVMSNQAAAVVLVPVALEVAAQLGVPGRPFAAIIAVAASCSYLTPLEPACLLVFGPGGYRFSDFPRYGAVLTVLVGALAVGLAPLVWPV
jgi:di/tricarboxylate transporter